MLALTTEFGFQALDIFSSMILTGQSHDRLLTALQNSIYCANSRAMSHRYSISYRTALRPESSTIICHIWFRSLGLAPDSVDRARCCCKLARVVGWLWLLVRVRMSRFDWLCLHMCSCPVVVHGHWRMGALYITANIIILVYRSTTLASNPWQCELMHVGTWCSGMHAFRPSCTWLHLDLFEYRRPTTNSINFVIFQFHFARVAFGD